MRPGGALSFAVAPAQAGAQCLGATTLGPGLRRGDDTAR
jgi:hypothetical protein